MVAAAAPPPVADPEPLLAPPAAAPTPAHWTPLTRFGFRFALIYFFFFLFGYGNGSLFSVFPYVGGRINSALAWPTNTLAEWTATHLFHITGAGAHFHPTGSGDTAVQWVQQFVFLALALAGAIVWTSLAHARGSRRTQYQLLYAWLRFLLRLATGMFMLDYGFAKLFPLQMAPISIAILNEPVGNMSPMTMLWSLIGLNPAYEMVCGAAEVLGGVLILFRRTALLGALVSAFVMTNVLLYNLFFDVPVKLFAANLLAALLFICLPDVPALYSFFWLHQPAAPAGIWVPPVQRRGFRIATRTVEIAYTVIFLAILPALEGYGWFKYRKDSRVPTPLYGAWHLDPTHPATGAFLTPEHQPITDFYVDTATRAFQRSPDGALWRTGMELHPADRTVAIDMWLSDPVLYSYRLPDSNHLVLDAQPPKPDAKSKPDPKLPAFVPATLAFTRTPVPDHYPLLDRGFHWVNEWGLER